MCLLKPDFVDSPKWTPPRRFSIVRQKCSDIWYNEIATDQPTLEVPLKILGQVSKHTFKLELTNWLDQTSLVEYTELFSYWSCDFPLFPIGIIFWKQTVHTVNRVNTQEPKVEAAGPVFQIRYSSGRQLIRLCWMKRWLEVQKTKDAISDSQTVIPLEVNPASIPCTSTQPTFTYTFLISLIKWQVVLNLV